MSTVSKTLFGNQHLLAVAVAVLNGGRTASSLGVQQVTGLPGSTIHRTFGKLEGVGVLRRIGSTSSDRVQRYERLPHPFWQAVRRFAEGTDQGERNVDGRQR
jgi:hypothetical protein